MNSLDLSIIEPQPTPAEDSKQALTRDEGGTNQSQGACEPGHDTRIARAEARTERAEARTEQAKTRTEQAETRTEQAESRTEQAKTRTEKAEKRTEEAETRSEQAIRASELSYRRLFEATRDGILILEADAGPSLSEKNLSLLTTISKAAIRMGNLIDDLLAFARLGRAELRKTNINLNELVREALNDLPANTKERNIDWEIHPLPSVRADCSLLRMALVNLISNAVKFTGARAQAKIEIGCAPGGEGETVIFVRDNGAGFDQKYAAKLFGVFQRLHSQNQFEGTGIGLANVQRIIHRHGGRIWAEGAVDGGATFYFSIPNKTEACRELQIRRVKGIPLVEEHPPDKEGHNEISTPHSALGG